MKTTARMLSGWISLAMSLLAGVALAGPLPATPEILLAPASMAQAGPQNEVPGDKRQQVDDLLRRARQAMTENDWAAADALISQADSLGLQYGPLHLGDTPKKARRDLEVKRHAVKTAAARPSQVFSPLLPNKDGGTKAPVTDPFLRRQGMQPPPTAAAGSPDPQQITPLPQVNFPESLGAELSQTSPVRPLPPEDLSTSPFGRAMPGPPAGADPGLPPALIPGAAAAKMANGAGDKNDLLRSARRALAVGDVRRATVFVQQARAQQTPYDPLDDNPDKVEAAIRKYQEVTAQQSNSEGYRRAYARMLMEQAQALLRLDAYDDAEQLATQAGRQQLTFGPFEPKPDDLLQQISAARRQGRPAGPLPDAQGALPVPAMPGASPAAAEADRAVSRAVYDAGRDATHNVPAGHEEPWTRGPSPLPLGRDAEEVPVPPLRESELIAPEEPKPIETAGMSLFRQGEEALKAEDKQRAYELFQQAAKHVDELDPATAQRLHDHLQLLSPPAATQPTGGPSRSLADEAAAKQNAAVKQVFSEVARQESKAKAMREKDPKGALALLEEARGKVEAAGLEAGTREQLLRRIERAAADTRQYIEKNQPRLELEEKNKQTHEAVEREKRVRQETDQKLALKIDECNRLMDERRFAEAEVAAKQAAELAPKNPVVMQLLWQTKFVRRFMNDKATEAAKEEGFVKALENVDIADIPFDDMNPYQHGDAKRWQELTGRRAKLLAERGRHRSEHELEIERKLKTPVSMQFKDTPLSKVIDYLAKTADINLVLDPQGLSQEGVNSDTPITFEVHSEIMLKSVLNLILQPLHLSYVVKDEVLKITSEQNRDGQITQKVYNVADLVIPIPNFMPGEGGLQGSYNNAMAHVGFGGGGSPWGGAVTPLTVVASRNSAAANPAINPGLLAQMSPPPPGKAPRATPLGAGPGGVGGGVQPDFQSLEELITSTVAPTTWDSVGGPGSISHFETNLSLVVSQTQEVHEQIADLLEQLRRLADLQVTIEVRFITLNDNFFERIGVDFDFTYNNSSARSKENGNPNTLPNQFFADINKHMVAGLAAPGGANGPLFNADLDIPVTQNNFALAVPQFGGFDASAGASLGFAILSDIEAYFFIAAAQGDTRTNVLQAPKVTLFNGQMASVSDISQSPFVMSVIPVVGDFAAAQQPVIVVLSEGTFMTVQAVVSSDHRFVRLTVVPYFSKIDSVRTFTFTGAQSTTTDTSAQGWVNSSDPNDTRRQNNRTATNSNNVGTTVQLPTFSFVNVLTTVSVPDGGTVLLGGIKRLREGRSEFGVPILDKVPYLNRLFKNVGIGRETQSLMMMVTPRIIIQEEEEEKLGVTTP